MKYAFLLYDDQANNDESPEMMARWFAVDGETVAAGVNRGGEALYPVAMSKTVRVRTGNPDVTDGPFAETKEQLGGFSVAIFGSQEAALAHAARVPTAVAGCIEVRPVLEMSAE